MRYVSEAFAAAMKRRPYIAKITLDGTDTIQGDPVKSIDFSSGANSDSDAISIGCVVASSVEVVLEKSLVSVALTDRQMSVALGIQLDSDVEWLNMGGYKITDVKGDDDTIVVIGLDPVAERLESEYEDISGIDFTNEAGVSSKAFMAAVCSLKGIPLDIEELDDIKLTGFLPVGCTYRQLIGMVAGLYGRFAFIDRDGVMRFQWYRRTNIEVTSNEYYEGALEKAEYSFSVSWVKCYNEVMEETLVEGNANADQGIYFSCPWMTQYRLVDVWDLVNGFSYVPVSGLSFMGDPRLDPGDIITVTNLDGDTFSVPVMTISHEFDGGLRTEVSAQGQVKTDAYEGPVQRETKRTIAKIVKTQEGILMSVENAESEFSRLELKADEIAGRVQDAEGNIGSLEVRADELEAEVQDASGNIANLQIRADEIASEVSDISGNVANLTVKSDEITGRVENAEGDLSQVKQTAGQVSVEAVDDTGKLETRINPNEWLTQKTDADGNVVSSFRFDFEAGQFVYDGTGKFMSKDGNSYITVEGSEFVLYSRAGTKGEMIDIARIGFTEDSEGYDYPYFLMGNAAADGSNFDKIGLIKMFKNGLYAGNSAPRNSTGSFFGMTGAAGFFVDTMNATAYVVSGLNMKELYTGTVDATFA